MKKNTIMTIIGTVIVLLLLVIYFSYAFLTDIHNISNLNVSTYTGHNTTLSSDGRQEFVLEAKRSLMGEDNIGNVVDSVTSPINVTLETDNDSITCCDFSIVLGEWCVLNDYYDGISFDINRDSVHLNHSVVTSNPLDYYEDVIYSDTICASKETSGFTKQYQLTATLTNTDTVQDSIKDENLCFYATVNNDGCTSAPLLTGIVKGQDVMGKVDEESEAIPTGTRSALINYGTYGTRYVGSEPNNYILFNCEDVNNPTIDTCQRWQIIGLFDDNVHGVDDTKLVKIGYFDIISNSLIFDGKPKYTGSTLNANYGSNEWYDSQLMMLLNPTSTLPSGFTINSQTGDVLDGNGNVAFKNYGAFYYGLNDGYIPSHPVGGSVGLESYDFSSVGLKNDDVRNMIKQDITWHYPANSYMSSSTIALSYETPIELFELERESQTGYEWTGPITIIYPSDYYFITTGSDNYTRTECFQQSTLQSSVSSRKAWNYQYGNCQQSSWIWNKKTKLADGIALFEKFDRTGSQSMIGLAPVGTISVPSAPDPNKLYFPTLYLNGNIRVLSGRGTYNDPYVLGA